MDMSPDDYVFTLLLMSSVVRQLRGRPLTWFGLSWPVALVLWAAVKYLGGVPSDRSDVTFVVVMAGVGAVLGLSCGALSRVFLQSGEEGGRPKVMVRSTGFAAALWILGTGSRLVFGLYAEHGGAQTVAAWSAHMRITGIGTWSTALILMSLLEVLGRTAILLPRRVLCQQSSRVPISAVTPAGR